MLDPTEKKTTTPPPHAAPPESSPAAEPGSAESLAPAATTAAPAAPEPDHTAELLRLQDELAAANDRVLRAQAELENFRKRVYRQMDEERKYAALPLLRDLVPVVDNLERALGTAASDVSGLLAGVRMILQQLQSALERHHCQRIPAEGAVFDPHVHEAIAQHPSDEHPAGTVMAVTQVGYVLHDRVVRPAQVLVSAGPVTAAPAGPGAADPIPDPT